MPVPSLMCEKAMHQCAGPAFPAGPCLVVLRRPHLLWLCGQIDDEKLCFRFAIYHRPVQGRPHRLLQSNVATQAAESVVPLLELGGDCRGVGTIVPLRTADLLIKRDTETRSTMFVSKMTEIMKGLSLVAWSLGECFAPHNLLSASP